MPAYQIGKRAKGEGPVRTRSAAVVGRRIRAAREARDLTQADLATALGRTPTSVSYWEGGQRSPGLDDLVEIARVLGIDPATLLPSQPPRVLARAQAAELAIGDLVAVVDGLMDRFEQLAPLDPLPTFASANPVEVADTARRAAEQHKPPVRIEPVMAACNVRFTVESLPEALSGLVVVVGGTPIVAVRGGDPPRRRRFSAAHELGHVLLAHHDTFHLDVSRTDGVPPYYNWRHERAANEFAAALLMPAVLLQADIERTARPTAARLAARYDVSEQAMSIRLSVLGIRPWESNAD
jgi:transcriptional regulator with XRE-family HTH domain